MTILAPDSFTRYLAAKKTVDDRALNAHVWETLVRSLPHVTAECPLRVLEVGAGIGTMVERLTERGVLTHAAYTAVDDQAENIAEARRRLAGKTGRVQVALHTADLFDFIRQRAGQTWDLLIAHAVLDLLDVPTALPKLLGGLRPGGLFYFTLNFDGGTIFQPEIDPAFDARIEALYHRTMDERIIGGQRSGDSRTGRRLFGHARQAGAEVLAAGSADWVVFAGPQGYLADEAYFLRFIVNTLQRALTGQAGLDAARFDAWIAERRAQIERGELVYIAHQLDVLGRTKTG